MSLFEFDPDIYDKVHAEGFAEGRFTTVFSLYHDNDITRETAISKLGMSQEEFDDKYKQYLMSIN